MVEKKCAAQWKTVFFLSYLIFIIASLESDVYTKRRNIYIIQIYCCIIHIFVLSCRKSWQAWGAGETGGQVFRGWVIHGLWNGLCYKFYEYSCTHRKSKCLIINTTISQMECEELLRQSHVGRGRTLGIGSSVFFFVFFFYTPKDHICSLTDLFGTFTQELYQLIHVTFYWKPLCFRMCTHSCFIHNKFDYFWGIPIWAKFFLNFLVRNPNTLTHGHS